MGGDVQNNAKTTGGCTGKGFQPGRSGNPGGRPKKRLITDQLEKLLKQKDPKTGKPNAELVAAGLIKLLAQGKNVPEILNRIEGPVRAAEDDIAASSLNAVTKLLDRLDADGAA